MLRSISKAIDLFGANCTYNDNLVTLSGTHGKVSMDCPSFVKFAINSDSVLLSIGDELTKNQKAIVGSFKAGLISHIKGIQFKHERVVIFTGTGSSVKVLSDKDSSGQFQYLNMRLGKSHEVNKRIPSNITCSVESADIRETRLKVSGVDAAAVGQFAAELRVRNPYKGGIHVWIQGQEIPLKEGKSG